MLYIWQNLHVRLSYLKVIRQFLDRKLKQNFYQICNTVFVTDVYIQKLFRKTPDIGS